MTIKIFGIPFNTQKNIIPQRFERKYYLATREIGMAYGLLRQICFMDNTYPSEQINSLYFDTATLDQHEQSSSGDFNKNKMRIRWYGEEETLSEMQNIFIELKSRQGFVGMKQRLELQVPAENLSLDNLVKGIVPRTTLMSTLAKFSHFPPDMLQPIIKISYWRYRFSEMMTGQRVSLDCHIRSTMIMPGSGNGEKELELPGAVIEIKGQTIEPPAALTRAKLLYTDWTRFSKYSICIDAHTEKPGTVGRLSPPGRIVRL